MIYGVMDKNQQLNIKYKSELNKVKLELYARTIS